MKIKLLDYGHEPIKTCALAARICYGINMDSLDKFDEWFNKGKGDKLIRSCIKNGHESVIEHAFFTFMIDSFSRVTSHQIARHRICSISQRSQRYCSEENTKFVIPPNITDKAVIKKIDKYYKTALKFYKELKKYGIKSEDARYVLPHSCMTTMVVTMNARELRHFFNLRIHNTAQWEIRNLAIYMLSLLCKHGYSIFFEDIIEKYSIGVLNEREQDKGKT